MSYVLPASGTSIGSSVQGTLGAVVAQRAEAAAGAVYDCIGVVSVFSQYMVYNCVYYCDTCYI
jgi:hypothetical protein